MKHLKAYENNKEPQVGDYVLCKYFAGADRIDNFIKNNIGQIVPGYSGDNKELRDHLYKNFRYRVKYENVPDDLNDYFGIRNLIAMNPKNIIHFSPNKKDLEAILISTNKYNL